jgi:hypothetical protein
MTVIQASQFERRRFSKALEATSEIVQTVVTPTPTPEQLRLWRCQRDANTIDPTNLQHLEAVEAAMLKLREPSELEKKIAADPMHVYWRDDSHPIHHVGPQPLPELSEELANVRSQFSRWR